jgi:hypothetical protein
MTARHPHAVPDWPEGSSTFDAVVVRRGICCKLAQQYRQWLHHLEDRDDSYAWGGGGVPPNLGPMGREG